MKKLQTKVPQSGGILMKGVQTHNSRKRPPANLDRKRWNARREW